LCKQGSRVHRHTKFYHRGEITGIGKESGGQFKTKIISSQNDNVLKGNKKIK
jgi:hypothetical protein